MTYVSMTTGSPFRGGWWSSLVWAPLLWSTVRACTSMAATERRHVVWEGCGCGRWAWLVDDRLSVKMTSGYHWQKTLGRGEAKVGLIFFRGGDYKLGYKQVLYPSPVYVPPHGSFIKDHYIMFISCIHSNNLIMHEILKLMMSW